MTEGQMLELPKVEQLLNLAAVVSNLNARELHEKWIRAQHGLLDMPVPATLAFSQIINIDLLLRQLEWERLSAGGSRGSELMLADQIVYAMSDTWMSQVYEVLRVTSNRAKSRGRTLSSELEAVKYAAALVRMGTAKGEVAEMNKKKNSAIQIQLQNTDGEIVPDYENDGDWIMPRGIRIDRGSCMWYCIDVSSGAPVPVEVCRQELSDQLLAAMLAVRAARDGG